jgi:N-acyl-D-amino-acid deacylase
MSSLQLAICRGKIVDGTGKSALRADLGIRDGRIIAVGDLGREKAERTIDAEGLVVAPGFIDIHSHSDSTILINRRAESKIHQGVTTEVIGNCGLTLAPLSNTHRRELQDYLSTTLGISEAEVSNWDWTSFGEYLDHLRREPLGINLAPLVGHGTLRVAVMGMANRAPGKTEMVTMENLLDRCLREGAFGMSTGLEYPPDAYSTTEELIRLGRVLAQHQAFYATHIRGEDQTLFEAIAEAVHIGKKSGCRVEISHLKAGGVGNWGKAPQLLDYLDKARERGVKVGWDQYPYTAWGTGLIDYMPQWVAADGREKLAARLRNEEIREAVKEEIAEAVKEGRHLLCAIPWEAVRIALVGTRGNKPLEGKNIAEIAAEKKQGPLDVVLNLLVEEKGAVKIVAFGISEDDVRTIMKHPATAIGSDGRAVAPYGALGRGKIHPRYYGTFPKVLGHYVREEKLLGLEEAIRKMTSLPAERMGLSNRGRIAVGAAADLVIFDGAAIIDKATFSKPHQYPEGIIDVIIGGQIVVHKGKHTGAMVGQVLTKRTHPHPG